VEIRFSLKIMPVAHIVVSHAQRIPELMESSGVGFAVWSMEIQRKSAQ